jgi:hypothetical protein
MLYFNVFLQVVSEEQEVGDEEEWTEEVGMIEEMILMDEGVVVDSEVDLMEEEVEGLMVDVGDLTVDEVDSIVVVEVDQGSRSVLHSGKMNLENHLQVIGQIVLSVINICVKN